MWIDHSDNEPESDPVTKCVGGITATQSIALFWYSSFLDDSPRNTSWVSSMTFHRRAVRSRAPTLTHWSVIIDATADTWSWCPNRVSTYAWPPALRDHVLIVRSNEPEKSCSPELCEEMCRVNERLATESRCCVNVFIGASVSASQIINFLSSPPVARYRPDGDTARVKMFPVCP